MAQPVQVDAPDSAPAQPLTADAQEARDSAQTTLHDAQTDATVLPISLIAPNPHQPRQSFDPASLQTLAESIRTDGVLQPVLVRSIAPAAHAGGAHRYELAAGERRLRAAQLAGLQHIPAIVRDLDDQQLAELALVENLQRQDLNPIERALGFQRLAERFGLSHEKIAARVGVERPTVSNTLRLLSLCESVRLLVRERTLSAGHAKALAALADARQQELLAKQAVRRGWSVRQLETAVRRAAAGAQEPTAPAGQRAPHLADLEQQIARQLGTKVRLRSGRTKGAGSLTIRFYSLDQFDELMARLGVETT